MIIKERGRNLEEKIFEYFTTTKVDKHGKIQEKKKKFNLLNSYSDARLRKTFDNLITNTASFFVLSSLQASSNNNSSSDTV